MSCIFSTNGQTKRGQLFEGDDYFKNCLLEDGSKYFFYYYPIKPKLITSNTLNMGFLSVANLVP